jgi:hypothetical protein
MEVVSVIAEDVSFDSEFSGHTTPGSQALLEQHPLNPVDEQA